MVGIFYLNIGEVIVMKLEKFRKNNRKSKIIFGSLIGMLLLVGSVFFFKTYAFYEEKKSFNILKGKVPNFMENDVTLAIRLNGEIVKEIPKGKSYKVDVTCDKGAKGSWDYENWGPNIRNVTEKTRCQIDFSTNTTNLYYQSEIGDYVSYTPEKISYNIPSSLTGLETDQTINPSELNVWRIIRKNNDGTIELVSEYTSSKEIYFKGKEGYKNYIGTLNRIAKSYETENITLRSRYIGYNGQTEFITDETVLNGIISPWVDSTTSSNSYKGSIRESLGSGDVLYVTDTELIQAACGHVRAKDISTKSIERDYWLGSRYFVNDDENGSFNIRIVHISGGIYSGPLYSYKDGTELDHRRMIRPIVTLKSEIQSISGDGKSELSAWKIK